MSYDVHSITFPLPATGADDDVLVYKHAATGGKITILDCYVTNAATTSSTPSFTIELHRYSSAGTPVLQGTAGASVGGTGDHWTADVPKSLTLDSTYKVVDEGECLVLSYAEVDGGTHTKGYATIHYVMGK